MGSDGYTFCKPWPPQRRFLLTTPHPTMAHAMAALIILLVDCQPSTPLEVANLVVWRDMPSRKQLGAKSAPWL